MHTEAVAWGDGGALIVLDQTRLPDEHIRLSLNTIDDVVEAIRLLRVRGAPLIGVSAAMGLSACAARAQRENDLVGDAARSWLDVTSATLRQARPTAVNLAWAVDRVHQEAVAAIEDVPSSAAADALVASLRRSAQRLWDDDAERCMAMGRHGADIMPRAANVLTICNTGMLATGGIGTAFGVIRTAFERGEVHHVYACETRPLCQGARLTSWELARHKIPATVLVDSAAATVLSTGRINFVIAGADRIAMNGDTANKIGTLGLANLARAYGVPFYIAAPLSTIDSNCENGAGIPIEERDPAEIARVAAGVKVFNPAFDVTPAKLIQGIVTEVGVLRPPFEDTIRSAMDGQ